jgi:hypothetical protein
LRQQSAAFLNANNRPYLSRVREKFLMTTSRSLRTATAPLGRLRGKFRIFERVSSFAVYQLPDPVLFSFLSILVVSFLALLRALVGAADGYEDELGFHFGVVPK